MKMMKFAIFIISLLFFFGCGLNRFDAVRFLIDTEKLEKAELVLNHMNKREKDTFDYNYLSGLVLVRENLAHNKNEALKFFLKADEYDSGSYSNNIMISKMYAETGHFSEAEKFALKAKEFLPENQIATYDDDAHYLLAKIHFKMGEYEKAAKDLGASLFQNDENVVFLRAEISDLQNGSKLLDDLMETYRQKNLLSDDMQVEYMDYLFLQKRIEDAEILSDIFLTESSPFLNYYGHLFKAFIDMLGGDLESAKSRIKMSLEYTVNDSAFFLYKIKVFYAYLAEENPVKVFNSFLIYKFFYDNTSEKSITAKEDLTEVEEYFANDIYFNQLKEEVQPRRNALKK